MSEIIIEGRRYIFAAAAAASAGVSTDYISRLCRQGKVKAHRFAGQWLVSASSLQAYLATTRGHTDASEPHSPQQPSDYE